MGYTRFESCWISLRVELVLGSGRVSTGFRSIDLKLVQVTDAACRFQEILANKLLIVVASPSLLQCPRGIFGLQEFPSHLARIPRRPSKNSLENWVFFPHFNLRQFSTKLRNPPYVHNKTNRMLVVMRLTFRSKPAKFGQEKSSVLEPSVRRLKFEFNETKLMVEFVVMGGK